MLSKIVKPVEVIRKALKHGINKNNLIIVKIRQSYKKRRKYTSIMRISCS